MTIEEYKLLIDGQLVAGDRTMDVVNPATEKVFATVARASANQANAAVASARRAFTTWAATPLEERQAKIVTLADAIAGSKDQLADALVSEQGKPLAEASGEVDWAEGYLRHYATLSPSSRVIQEDDTCRIESRREPLGVVVGILPWNFPLLLAVWKLGPALIAGNSIVIKPSPTTPVTTLILAALCRNIFPPGVVNVITDDGDLGPLLTAHPDVAKVSFTGSAVTGRKILANGADGLKRITLELGGNDAAIVLGDVNVEAIAEKIYQAAFMNAGQVCLAIKRAYVHESIYDEMCAALERLARQAVVDDGAKPATTQGPLQNIAQYKKVKELLDRAAIDGAVLGNEGPVNKQGYFIRPAIVRDVSDGDRIVDEEQFGPILPLIKFTDIEEVIARVNNSEYGLGGSVWSADLDKATEIANRIESGSVWVNQHINIGPHIPMAGYKQSGIGVEQSQEGLDEFTQMRVINIAK